MVLAKGGKPAKALVVPFLARLSGVDSLVTEAECLWKAEQPSAAIGAISAEWGSVGARFRDQLVDSEIFNAWGEYFLQKGRAISPISEDGLLDISWPLQNDEIDVILATATKAEHERPTPEQVAQAWVDQNQGHEAYFFENVKCGIRTPDDHAIWRYFAARQPSWISKAAYSNAITILQSESSV